MALMATPKGVAGNGMGSFVSKNMTDAHNTLTPEKSVRKSFMKESKRS